MKLTITPTKEFIEAQGSRARMRPGARAAWMRRWRRTRPAAPRPAWTW